MGNRENILDEDIHDIVSIMRKDPVLVRSSEKFYNSLGLPSGEMIDVVQRAKSSGSESYTFFSECLRMWISRKGSEAKFGILTSVLRKEDFGSVAEEILKYGSSRNAKDDSDVIWFEVPEDTLNFTGRTTELEKLHQSITKANGYNATVITTVSGLGGIGKTTLALHYAWVYKDFYENVIWINAENSASLRDSFDRLGDILEIEVSISKGDLLKQKIAGIYKYFGSRNSLFIFDNAEAEGDLTNGFLSVVSSPKMKKPYLLLTSRNNDWSDRFPIIELNVFSEEESVDFIRDYLHLREKLELELATTLSNTLDRLPIAVRQAAAYIKAQRMPNKVALREYLAIFEAKTKSLLNYEYWKQTGDLYRRTTYVTWDVTFEKLKQDPLALRILRIISFLGPDNIPVLCFKYTKFKHEFRNLSRIREAIALISQYSIAMITDGGDTLRVHRLVQTVIRDQLDKNELVQYLQDSIDMLKMCFTIGSTSLQNLCLLHSESVRYHARINMSVNQYMSFEEFILRHRNTFTTSTLQEGEALYRQGKYLEALELYQEYVQQHYRRDPDSHTYALHVLFKLGETYTALKNYKVALEHYDEVINSVEFNTIAQRSNTTTPFQFWMHLPDEDIITTFRKWYELRDILGYQYVQPLVITKIVEGIETKVNGEVTMEMLRLLALFPDATRDDLSVVFPKSESSLLWLIESSLVYQKIGLCICIRNPIVMVWMTDFGPPLTTFGKITLERYVTNQILKYSNSKDDSNMLWMQILRCKDISHEFSSFGVEVCKQVCPKDLKYRSKRTVIIDTVNTFRTRLDERFSDIIRIIETIVSVVKYYEFDFKVVQVVVDSTSILHKTMVEYGQKDQLRELLTKQRSNEIELRNLTASLELLVNNKCVHIEHKNKLQEHIDFFSKPILQVHQQMKSLSF